MCVIAGYTGKKRAAPILIEMLRKIERFDSGSPTGIVTLHEGKLYVAKALGDVDMLLKMTDAMDLPGTTGLIHSRPGEDFINTCHPYMDASGKYAMMGNGTLNGTGNEDYFAEMRAIMDDLLDRGISSPNSRDKLWELGYSKLAYTKDGKPFYPIANPYSLGIGDAVKDAPKENMKEALAKATKAMHERIPTDNISVGVHADLPDTITVCTVTRPMSVLEAEGECYLASCAIAFPEDVKGKITHLVPCSLSQVTPNGLEILATELEGVRVEHMNERILSIYSDAIIDQMSKKPTSLYEFKHPENVWSEPMVDCDRFVRPGTKLKADMHAVYQVLYRLYKEGRLTYRTELLYGRDVAWPSRDCYITKFKVD